MNLDKRLEKIIELLPKVKVVVDVGTDHGYIPIQIIKKNLAEKVIATDINNNPLANAKENIKKARLDKKITCILSDGLKELQNVDFDVLIIAGMGGKLIIDILKTDIKLKNKIKDIVLQPMEDAYSVRKYLVENGFTISNEALVKDRDRFYEIISAKPKEQKILENWQYEIGPINWEKKDKNLKEFIFSKLAKKEKILKEMENSEQAKKSFKYYQLKEMIKILEVKSCQLS